MTDLTIPNLSTVTIRELMSDDTTTVAPDRPVAELARELLDRRVSGLPVVEGGTLIGMVSEYDVIHRRGATVGEIMSKGVISISDDARADQVASLMGLHGIRRVPVVRDGQLVGIISRDDLLRLFTSAR